MSFLFLPLTITIFTFGVLGLILNSTNLMIMLMSIELIILAVNLNFMFFGLVLDDSLGSVLAIIMLALAAAESSLGLAFIMSYYSNKGNMSILFLNLMKN